MCVHAWPTCVHARSGKMLTNTDMLFVSQEHDACAEAEENLQRLLGKKTDLEAHLQVSFRCAGFVLLAYCNWSTLCLTQK